MTQTRFAKGPDGSTRGFYPGWRQERRLLRSLKAQQPTGREQPAARPRATPAPPSPPTLYSQLDVAPPPPPPPPPNMGVDPDTGEIFMLSDWDPHTAHAAQQAVDAQAASAASAADMTERLRAMFAQMQTASPPPTAQAYIAAPPLRVPPFAGAADASALTHQLRAHDIRTAPASRPPVPAQQAQQPRPQPPAQTWQQQANVQQQWQPALPAQHPPVAAANASSSLKLLLGVGQL